MNRLHEQLDGIHREISKDIHIEGPALIELFEHDFPEKNLELIIELPKSKRAREELYISIVPKVGI